MAMNPLLPFYFAETLVESIEFGYSSDVATNARSGVQPGIECVYRNGRTNHASAEAQDVGVIMFAC
jgi:hypothetical protein